MCLDELRFALRIFPTSDAPDPVVLEALVDPRSLRFMLFRELALYSCFRYAPRVCVLPILFLAELSRELSTRSSLDRF